MSESIFIRVQRVLSAGADSAVVAAERLSGAGLMRQAIRDLDGAMDDVRRAQDGAEGRRVHTEHQHRRLREKLATLDEQARYAMAKQREDLAEAAVGQQITVEDQIVAVKKTQAEAVAELKRLGESMAALKLRRKQMEAEFAAFGKAQREADLATPGHSAAQRNNKRADRAEEAFARGMAAAGGADRVLTPTGDAAKLAEVDAMRRADAVAARLAALRTPNSAPSRSRKRAS